MPARFNALTISLRPVNFRRQRCVCASRADLDKRVYQPGEKGVGKAEFKVSSFTGRHEKTVHVQTDDPAQSQWVIPFVLEVPEVIKIEPKTLQWWVGDAVDAKTSRVIMTGPEPMTIKSYVFIFTWKSTGSGCAQAMRFHPQKRCAGRETKSFLRML